MRKTVLLFFLTLWPSLTVLLCAQPVSLTEIPALKRLPVNAIHRIFQDSEGYIWYGTVNGLCRDDGYRIQTFRSDFNHRGLLANNLIECIAEDRYGRIWFGTNKGAYILDKKDYTIRRINHNLLNGQIVPQIYTTSDGDLWLSVKGALLRFDPSGKCKKHYDIRNGTSPTTIAGFCESRNHDIIITIWGCSVCRLDKEKDCLTPFPDLMRKRNPGALVQDSKHDYFWICTWGDGLVRFDPSAKDKDSMFIYQEDITDATKNLMYIATDKEHDRLWATSLTHLLAFDIKSGKAVRDTSYDNLPAHVMLNEIIADRHGDFWVSAFDRPSFILHNKTGQVKTFSLPALQERHNYHAAVMALCDSGEGIVWLHQEREGIFLYDLHNNRATGHKQSPTTTGLPFSMVKIMTESQLDKAVWIAPEHQSQAYRLSRHGMEMYAVNTVNFSPYTNNKAITTLHEDRQGQHLYAGTMKGLFRHDLHNGKTTAICDTMGHVTGIIEAEDHTLYICTYDKGVYALSPDGDMHRYKLPQAFSCLTRTTDGTLWLGSDEGDLISLDPHDGTTHSYNEMCHLNGNMVNRVMADDFNHIWVGTNQQIIEFNPHNGSYRTYPTTDGSAGLWRIIPTALCKGKDGNLYFGGISGISRFTPSNTLEREATPTCVTITDLRTGTRSLLFDLHRPYHKKEYIEITAEEKNLTVCFSSLNHRTAHKTRYAYRMKDIDKEWQYISGHTAEAVYSHLPKGEYEFEVKATDENGQWSRSATTLRIHRLPAWYESWWAYLIYIGIIAGAVGIGIYRYVRRMKKRNDELWADSKEMLQMREYLNMTHEEENAEAESLSRMLMDKAVRLVEENMSEPDFDVQRLAEGMNMSRSTLTRKLKSISGDTPLEFIRHIKMKHACRMLKDKQMNVSEVAAALGYYNRKYFTNCFKEEFGMTPSEYQKRELDDELDMARG